MQNSIKPIPLEEHDKFALLWTLADEIKQDGRTSEKCWLQIMDAFWIGDLPTLFCFTLRKDGAEGRDLFELPSRDVIAEYLCKPRNAVDYAALRGWTLQDYKEDELFNLYVTSSARFGLAIRRKDFERWRENMVSYRLSMDERRDSPKPRRRVVKKSAHEFAQSYIDNEKQAGRQPTQLGLEKAALTADLRGWREHLRTAFKTIQAHAGVEVRPGRIRKSTQ